MLYSEMQRGSSALWNKYIVFRKAVHLLLEAAEYSPLSSSKSIPLTEEIYYDLLLSRFLGKMHYVMSLIHCALFSTCATQNHQKLLNSHTAPWRFASPEGDKQSLVLGRC